MTKSKENNALELPEQELKKIWKAHKNDVLYLNFYYRGLLETFKLSVQELDYLIVKEVETKSLRKLLIENLQEYFASYEITVIYFPE